MRNFVTYFLLPFLATVILFKLMNLILNFAWVAFVFAYIVNPLLVYILLPVTLFLDLCKLIDKRRLKATA